jgi:FMN reductase
VKVALVYGAVTPPGRLSSALDHAADRLACEGAACPRVDLAEVVLPFAPGTLDERGRAAVEAVMSAQAMLVASPVYRASFPGVLKNFFDYLLVEALAAKPVAWVAVGATAHHFLGVDRHLRDVLSWFGAVPLPTSVYLTNDDFVSGKPSAAAVAEIDAVAETLIDFVKRLEGSKPGPTPLAARR